MDSSGDSRTLGRITKAVSGLTLKRKMIFLIMSVSSAMLLFCATFLLAYHHLDQRRQISIEHRILGRTIASTATGAVSFQDAKAAAEILSALAFTADVKYAALTDQHGAILGEYRAAGETGAYPIPHSTDTIVKESFAGGAFRMTVPVLLHDEPIGGLFLYSNLARYQQTGRLFVIMVISSLCVTFLLGLYLASKMQRIVSAPILHLAAVARKVAGEGDYSIRARLNSDGEIGLLVNDFNQMLKVVESSSTELHEAHQQLEERVRERTAELIDEISERKKAEDALRREQEQLRSIILNAPAAMAMFDTELRYLVHNKQWKEVYRIAEDTELAGLSQSELFPEAEETWNAIKEAAQLGNRVVRDEESVFLADGSQGVVRWAVQPWYTPEGALGGVIQASERIDDLVRSREEALRIAKLRSQFLANMSHELRTPLNGVIGFTSLLIDTPLSSEQREYAETIRSSASSLLRIINDILDFSKIEAGKLEPDNVQFSLSTLLQESLATVRATAMQKNLKLTLDAAPGLPEAYYGDPIRLQQVLLNLLGNAVKFTERGEVELQIQLIEETPLYALLQFSIRDTGIGIAEAKQHEIFEAFAQGDGSVTRVFGGTGLGLTICRQLVEIFGGRLWLESRLGLGSTFHFSARLQRADARPEDARPAAPVRPTGPELRQLHVLVAEDNRVNQRLISRLLEREGHHVEVVENGRDALERLLEARFDLVLMDLQMPVLGGIDAVRLMREASEELRKIPVVALTAHAFEEDRKRCLEAGMNGFLAKPVVREELSELLAKMHETE